MLERVHAVFRRGGAMWIHAFILASGLLLAAAGAAASTFTVNSTADVPDADPLNGVCETAPGNGICTLRGAIQAANVHAGADVIMLPANTYLLTQVGAENKALSGDLDILDSVTIVGAGAATTIIDGNGSVTGERVFEIFACTGGSTAVCDADHPPVVVSMSGVTIQHGQSFNIAGGIYNQGSLTLTHCVVANNSVSGINDLGGGIQNAVGATLALISSTVRDNTTGNHNAYGGGIMNEGSMTITNSTISGNKTFAGTISPGIGGGVFTREATITGSTISGNIAVNGGGIYKTANLIVINSTISGNSSTVSGGGIYAASGTVDLYNVTVTQNTANSDATGYGIGGGVANASGSTFNFRNSIIALNSNVIPMTPYPLLNADDCYGTITSQANNIMYAVDAGYCTVVGAVSLVDPSLGPLQANGGPTQTHALLAGSAAIDGVVVGDCIDNLGATLATDQRGVHRPNGAHCDIGAYEANDIIFRDGFEP